MNCLNNTNKISYRAFTSYANKCEDFEDVNKTSSVKKSLEEQRKSSRNTEYLLLDSYFDDLISKWRF